LGPVELNRYAEAPLLVTVMAYVWPRVEVLAAVVVAGVVVVVVLAATVMSVVSIGPGVAFCEKTVLIIIAVLSGGMPSTSIVADTLELEQKYG